VLSRCTSLHVCHLFSPPHSSQAPFIFDTLLCTLMCLYVHIQTYMYGCILIYMYIYTYIYIYIYTYFTDSALCLTLAGSAISFLEPVRIKTNEEPKRNKKLSEERKKGSDGLFLSLLLVVSLSLARCHSG